MVILMDMTLCRVNKNNGVATEERKLPMRREREFESVYEMDKFLDRLTRLHYPGKEINATYQTIKISQVKELQKLMDETGAWSNHTFDNGNFSQQRCVPISYHLQKETKELTEALEKFFQSPTLLNKTDAEKEFSDCFILLLDAGNKFGLSAREMIYNAFDKLEINRKRKWGKPDEHGVVEHIREQE
ncbi:MAG: hypothetical protein A2W93_14315 [Bacteroidetes bacterium GWF2_43_63]|nr:MAG: hypothetical protein A2W94_00885 [Bacteroidetes bacterium GWE2_42_42]OFY52515.1 MAG: hypothetical protein A2W93_14315 [Bacteroidetes bacterium GWF2_43_63]HBG71422.1 hypothetical protein [Bacteroidales bacterium]HCB60826.1 hypothetical protein [Bacteroidales bacterium]HCY23449.1 hypothetical protein [Bacteroidales bacterium]